MADNEQKARELVAEAEKKLNSKGFLGGLFGSVTFTYLLMNDDILFYDSWTFNEQGLW